jgi:ubiquinone/menaquinone biosynthesis C-methylase UbiE
MMPTNRPDIGRLRDSYDRLAAAYAEMVAVARRLTPAVSFREGSMLDLPDPDASWAGCTAFYAIVHFDEGELKRALREIARVLRPRGVLLLAFHQGSEIVHRDDLFGVAVDLDFVFWEAATVARELRDAGFVIEAKLERAPYEGHEHPSRRIYLFARRGE